jgi:hypothetical protein
VPGTEQDSDEALVLAELRQRFVALPDPSGPTGWLVDLRDPFHPVIHRYETWAAAEDGAIAMIAQNVRKQVVVPFEGIAFDATAED